MGNWAPFAHRVVATEGKGSRWWRKCCIQVCTAALFIQREGEHKGATSQLPDEEERGCRTFIHERQEAEAKNRVGNSDWLILLPS